MAYPNPVPAGSSLVADWNQTNPGTPPALPTQWTASVLLSPFGDSISPLENYSQLVLGTIDYYYDSEFSFMRARLYNSVDLTYFDFAFFHYAQSENFAQDGWIWIDSTPDGTIRNAYGPFRTTLRVPDPTFFSDNGAQWGNTYPLMGINCNHWVVPTPGPADHGSWYTWRQDTGQLFRIFMMDSTNPLMLPILGSYYIANIPTLITGLSDGTRKLIERVRKRESLTQQSAYWNPLVTQEDIQRAMAFPLASASCTLQHLQAVIPGFTPMPSGVPTPQWNNQTYIEGWTLGTDFIPYWTQVCYLWTGDENSKQQSVFAGLGLNAGLGTYLQRSDCCLDMNGTTQPYYTYPASGPGSWTLSQCQPSFPVGLPYPDWLTRDGGTAMGRIAGNANFGLASGQVMNLFAAQLPRGSGEMAIFWLWFTSDGNGVLFTEGNYMNPLSHDLQLIDYTLFVQNAGLSQSSFSGPCGWMSQQTKARAQPAPGHATRLSRKQKA